MDTSDSTTPLKYCPKGDHWLPETDEYFYRSKGKCYAPCKACKSKHDKEAGHKQVWFENNKDKQYKSNKRWSAANKDKQREYHTAYQREWRKANKERERSYRKRRRSAPGKHSANDLRVILKSQRGRCWWCKQLLDDNWEVDHRIPLARGGSNNANNLVISCQFCNRSKSDKMPWEFNGRLL